MGKLLKDKVATNYYTIYAKFYIPLIYYQMYIYIPLGMTQEGSEDGRVGFALGS